MTAPKDVLATLYYLANDTVYETEKPYTLEYYSRTIPKSNIRTRTVNDVCIKDLRGKEHEYTFDRNGFAIFEMHSAMCYEDFEDDDKVQSIYCEELGACVLNYLKASSIQMFDYAVGPVSRRPL